MTKHILTKTYSTLRGFSTDSQYVRPANVSTLGVNIAREPDGTFSPRRGYQVQSSPVGGLGNGIFENLDNGQIEPICIGSDGNLYIQKTGTMTISFVDPNSNTDSYISYEIFVDQTATTDTQECDFDPFQIISDDSLITDCLVFRVKQLRGFSGVAVGSGSATYSGTLSGSPLTPGSILITDGTYTIQDDAKGGFFGDIGSGTNTINYETGSYSISFSASTGTTTASYRTTLQTQLSLCMGKGFGVASPLTVGGLISQLNAITGVTVTSTGDTNQPAAFLEVVEETNIPHSQSVTLNWVYWIQAIKTVPSTFSGLAGQVSDPDFRIATFAAYEESVYIATGFDEIQKYDGQTVYRAGMPQGSINQVTTAAGTLNGDFKYYATYEQVDNNGRIVEGQASVEKEITLSSQFGVITVDNLVQGSGWNTNSALVNGTQSGVNTIVVDGDTGNPHSLQVGDVAYFFDGVTNEYVTRNITAITSTSITVDGDPVDVTDNKPISNNLKINIFRTQNGGTDRYLVVSLPNDSYNTTQAYTDSTTDANLIAGRRLPIPVRQPNPPPKTGVVVAFGNQLIFTQDPDNDDFVWFSEPGNPEYVSTAFNNFIVPSNSDDVIGAGVSGSNLLIFKNKSIYVVNGDLIANQFTVRSVAPGSNIGCVSHHTIVSVGGLIYFLHTNGVYTIVENQLYPTDKFGNPIPVTIMIDRFFRTENFIKNKKFVLKRATATNYTKDNQYLLFLPAENETGERVANENSRVLCFDYQAKNWFEWTRINAAGGWYVLNDNLYWQERILSNGVIVGKLYKQHRKYRLIDYVDHVTPIRVTWESSWEDLGQPRVRKKFVRTALLFDSISALFQKNIPTLCFTSYKNWVDNRESTRADLMQKINSSEWSNTQEWSYISWDGYQDPFITVSMKGGTVAKSMKMRLQMNKINSSFNFQGFQYEISPDFGRTIVR